MKSFMLNTCSADTHFFLNDPDAIAEVELEAHAVRILSCTYPDYLCFVFSGSFLHEGNIRKPDLAMVARDFSHWFVIEVELLSHSFKHHVMPQVRAFRYGKYQQSCVNILARELDITKAQATTLLKVVPKTVAVIVNKWDDKWYSYLDSHNIQMVKVQHYQTVNGDDAVQISGRLRAPTRSLGFGIYSAIDRSIKVRLSQAIPEGKVQLYAPDGTPGLWNARLDGAISWLTKIQGRPSIPDNATVQILADESGALSIKHPQVWRTREDSNL